MSSSTVRTRANWRRWAVSGLVVGLLSGGSGVALAQDANEGTVSLTDFRGHSMEVPVGSDGVVFLVENAMNTFYAVGGADRIAGIGDIWQPAFKEAFFSGVDPDYGATPRVASADGAVDSRIPGGHRPRAGGAVVGRYRRSRHHGHRGGPGRASLWCLPRFLR